MPAARQLQVGGSGRPHDPGDSVLHGATLDPVPTSHPRHSITETPALAAALEPLRARLGAQAPTLAELVMRGAESKLRELEAQDRAHARALATFVNRLCDAPQPDLEEIRRIRHTSRHL
jgi:hypothetical protein